MAELIPNPDQSDIKVCHFLTEAEECTICLGKGRNRVIQNVVSLKHSIMNKRINGVHKEPNMFYWLLAGILDKQCPEVKAMWKMLHGVS